MLRSWMLVAVSFGTLACLPVSTQRIRADPAAPAEPPMGTAMMFEVGTFVSVGEAARRRLDGECYVPCAQGSRCDRDTGLCEKIPCGGCPEGDECVGTGGHARCVAATAIPRTPFVVSEAPSP